ncbi:hypothetical protein [Vibrio hannami]
MASVNAEMPVFSETYDIEPAYCEGLNLHGVMYSFTVDGSPSMACMAGTYTGPGITNNIDAPNIEGTSAGILHLTFDVPTTIISFGIAQNTFSGNQAVYVDLYRPGVGLVREEVMLDLLADPGFVGGLFEYDGPAVKTMTISHSTISSRFAIDNLMYFRPKGQMK